MSIRIAIVDGDMAPGESPGNQHAEAVCSAIECECPEVRCLRFPIYENGSLVTNKQQLRVALEAVIDTHAREPVDIVHMSLGFREQDIALQTMVQKLVLTTSAMIASMPARGDICYPAAWQGVIAATGDARCKPGEFSWLGDALIGACPTVAGHRVAGASIGAARVSGLVAKLLCQGVEVSELLASARGACRYIGRERRR